MLTLNTNGLSTEDSYTKEFDSVTGQKVLTAHGLADNSTPVMVVANADKADDVAAAMTGIKNLEDPSKPDRQGRRRVHHRQPDRRLDHQRGVRHRRRGAHRRCTPSRAPTRWSSGNSAILDDMLKANTRDSKVIIPVTLIVVLLILMLLLRALTAPLILIATVVLSFGTALGLGALAFKYVFDYPAVDPSFPLFVFVFLVSLGIDYNIFLMTRVREETADPRHTGGLSGRPWRPRAA